VGSRNRKLRSGYTTGACAAAAAKAATRLLLGSESGAQGSENDREVTIPFPDGSRATFAIHRSAFRTQRSELISSASVIKDAGDDPDVTNGAEIVATVSVHAERGIRNPERAEILIKGGTGVGMMTKPGLAIPVGEPAINPVPRKMIREAVREAVRELRAGGLASEKNSAPRTRDAEPILEVTISVPGGEALAKKTLNHRLGIVGGISILGTTGIVRPVSAEAYTASITASMDVARAAGLDTVVLSSGRTSERAHMKAFHLPEESYVMMGDYVEFALEDAKKHGFKRIQLCAQWAKLIKTAMGAPQTHVRHGVLEAGKAAAFLASLGIAVPRERAFNTSREIYDFLTSGAGIPNSGFAAVCAAARRSAERITAGIPVTVHFVSYEGELLAASE
jgi:cobalt-precorrin-5B (C1)-methyltransferase